MEVPREFYRQHRHELVKYVNAEIQENIVFITLMRGQKQVVVQFKLEDFLSSSDRENEVQSTCVWPWIYEIAKYPKSISWAPSSGNWCYISRSKKGHLQFVQRDNNPAKSLQEPYWARLIAEEDIEFEEVGPLNFRSGTWRGRDVDVYRVWMESDFKLLKRAMRAYRRLQDTKLTYDLIGHLTDEFGDIVGLVTEPILGRPISLHDAALVFSALRRLNSIGYILDAPHEGSMLVTSSGELKITEMHNVVPLPRGSNPQDSKEREAKINKREEFCRLWVFGEMAKRMRGGVGERPEWRVRGSTRGMVVVPIHVMAPFEGPERVLSLTGGRRGSERDSVAIIRQSEGEWVVEKFKDTWSATRVEDAVGIWKLVRSGGVKRLLEVESTDEEEGSEDGGPSPNARPPKRLRGSGKGTGRARSETPLPSLPVPIEDYPLVPPWTFHVGENIRERSSSQTLYEESLSPTVVDISSPPPDAYSPRAVVAGNETEADIRSWLLEGDWLELAGQSRFEVVY